MDIYDFVGEKFEGKVGELPPPKVGGFLLQ